MAGRIVVGTSSWADPGFVEEWYPPGLPARERLPWYAQHFDAVEVNATFYAIPDAGTVARWAQVTPPGFSPKNHELDELRPIVERLAPHPVAIELRHRGWTDRLERTLGWFEDAGA